VKKKHCLAWTVTLKGYLNMRDFFYFCPMWAGFRHASIASTADLPSACTSGKAKTVRGTTHTKTVVVPIVVRVIVVATGDTRVVLIVIPRAAAQRQPNMPKPVKA
jgi:hypothetical protein